jgi:hypothetical protein
MYLRITMGRFDPARIDDVMPLAQRITAAIEELPGNQSQELGLDRTTGQVSNASTWDTVEHARFSRETAGVLGELVQRLQAMGVVFDPPIIMETVTA